MSSSSTGAGQEGNKASDSVDQSEGLNPETALPVPKAEDSPLQAPQRGRSRGRGRRQGRAGRSANNQEVKTEKEDSLPRRSSLRERAKPQAYSPTHQDRDTKRRRETMKQQERSSRDYSRQLSEDASGGQAIKVEAMSQEEGSGNSSSDDNVPLRLSARPSGQHPLIKTEMDGTANETALEDSRLLGVPSNAAPTDGLEQNHADNIKKEEPSVPSGTTTEGMAKTELPGGAAAEKQPIAAPNESNGTAHQANTDKKGREGRAAMKRHRESAGVSTQPASNSSAAEPQTSCPPLDPQAASVHMSKINADGALEANDKADGSGKEKLPAKAETPTAGAAELAAGQEVRQAAQDKNKPEAASAKEASKNSSPTRRPSQPSRPRKRQKVDLSSDSEDAGNDLAGAHGRHSVEEAAADAVNSDSPIRQSRTSRKRVRLAKAQGGASGSGEPEPKKPKPAEACQPHKEAEGRLNGKDAGPQKAVVRPVKDGTPLTGQPKAELLTKPTSKEQFRRHVAGINERLLSGSKQCIEIFQHAQQQASELLAQLMAEVQELEAVTVTEEVLQQTGIGKTVRNLAKPMKPLQQAADVEKRAMALLSRWMKAFPKEGRPPTAQQAAAGNAPPPGPKSAPATLSRAQPPAAQPPPTGAISQHAGPDQHALAAKPILSQAGHLSTASQPPSHQIVPSSRQHFAEETALKTPKKATLPPVGVPSETSDDATRDRARMLLETALLPEGHAIPPRLAAGRAEAALHSHYHDASPASEQAYLRRLRMLWSWLSPDGPAYRPALRDLIGQGLLDPGDLALMLSEEVEAVLQSHAAANAAVQASPPPPPPPPMASGVS